MIVGPIIPRKGLRQGDPLSPYLFLLCLEGLSNVLDNAAARNQISGCRISSTALEITHLLFADDNFLFFKATRDEVARVKSILMSYVEQSGQAINFKNPGFISA